MINPDLWLQEQDTDWLAAPANPRLTQCRRLLIWAAVVGMACFLTGFLIGA